MAYVVDLEAFHGPMDLLLYLIDKNQLDIYDIPIAVISDQYMEYLQSTGDFELEKLGDFLIMASYLLNLKSRMLLPQNPTMEQDEEGEAEDPREELVRSLLNYRKYKKAAEYLQIRQEGDSQRVYYRDAAGFERREEIVADLKTLFHAYQNFFRDKVISNNEYGLPRGDINVRDKMEEIVGRLQDRPQGLVFQDLFVGVINKREALALFLALLELVRLQKVEALQKTIFSEIKVYLRVAV